MFLTEDSVRAVDVPQNKTALSATAVNCWEWLLDAVDGNCCAFPAGSLCFFCLQQCVQSMVCYVHACESNGCSLLAQVRLGRELCPACFQGTLTRGLS